MSGRALFRLDANGVAIRNLGSPSDLMAYRQACAGARFEPKSLRWVAPTIELAMRISERLTKLGYSVLMDEPLRARITAEARKTRASIEDARDRLELFEKVAARSGRSLYEFQRQDVIWLSSRQYVVNCNDMGLGKTIETLAATPDGNTAVVVVCPSIAKGVWRRETARWRPDLVVDVRNGRGSFRFPKRGEMVVINYDLLPTNYEDCPGFEDAKLFVESGGELVVVSDEGHFLTNPKSLRSKSMKKLFALASRRMVLTGTPLPNKPEQLWNVLDVIGVAHEAFVSKKEFVRVFNGKEVWHNCGECDACEANKNRDCGSCDACISNSEIEEVDGVLQGLPLSCTDKKPAKKCDDRRWRGYEWGDPTPEAGERLKRVLVRHLKTEVLQDFPEKTHRIIDVEPANKRLLDNAMQAYPGFLDVQDIKDIPFEKMSAACALLCSLKADAIMEIADSHEQQEEPLVVFAAHRDVIEILGRRPGWAMIVGGMSHEKRTKIEEDFQAGKLIGIAATVQAASTAITLTRSRHVYFVDHSWTPAENQQAEDRCWRIGQTRGVIISHLVMEHPLDAHMWKLLAKKMGIIEGSVEKAREYKRITDEQIDALVPPDPSAAPHKKNCRPPQSDEERKYASALVKIAGMTDEPGLMNGVFVRDRKSVVSIAAELVTTGTLSRDQWKIAVMHGKRYSSLLTKEKKS